MRGKHTRKAPKFRIFRAAAVFTLAMVFCGLSFSTVMADTVSANVVDGDQSYTFSMDSADLEQILAQAQRQGLRELGPLDVAEQVENTTTVNIRRGVRLTVMDAGKSTGVVAYRGDTVGKMLSDNNFALGRKDAVTPDLTAPVEEGMQVVITRSYEVTLTADGSTRTLEVAGGTVGQVLAQAGVETAPDDTVNFEDDAPVYDQMHIRVSRPVSITVTVDGESEDYRVSAGSVRSALEKLEIDWSEDDEMNVSLSDRLTDGLEIVIDRVETEEVVEDEDIEYVTEYIDSDDLTQGQEEILTAGQLGLRRRTYKLITRGGELLAKELVDEEVLEEPVAEVILRGTGEPEEPQEEPQENSDSAGGSAQEAGSLGAVQYVDKLVGECTAYYPTYEGCGTATGVKAGYGCIAVNPYVIPYGSLLYITSPDGSIVYGYGTAVDTGGACMAGDILADLCYDTEAECSIIGRRDMVIYVIRYGY